jgi:HEAT repeat protein
VRADAKAPTEVAQAATLTLGAVAGQVRAADPGRADAIADEIADATAAEKDPAALAVDLAALGNARSPRAAEVAQAHVGDDDAMVRRMAVFALSRAGDPDSRATIARLAESDQDQAVRDAAKRALATGG